ncbi:hypothetical protein NIES2135_67300 (plasmid) [Leptolyngbya boryana NIES-2135]|jgi:hypothetical protein|uniref:Uncharacterized protein n=1 Tax=Leptolyngbya boryana NIES-2135 TaxID=1973484 RepID=A0A1Z4JT79_LEPBY|nr:MULTISPECIES: hypothetical protein [Leptolyngbya]BAY59853.1 hypothetical protein NIES2135_67300 [Leptolyngbya boryana NIES-2135]MBD2369596.1 hypothetical protein [Leptolyngbya sp. FACHB-161]MBD2375959.1 hypothetical protein [Leptolyngbya sp. FACHB-238]MBD2400235.1 hypothetical protein [Leptolyngbya sp. FACHB-239]MBD2406776.1 hypothetical protein [Leptolyngbya sp. FACHB-402]
MQLLHTYQRTRKQIWRSISCTILILLIWAVSSEAVQASPLLFPAQIPLEIAQLQSTSSIFESILNALRQTGVPLRLPPRIPLKSPIYTVLWNASKQGYQVAFTTSPDCRANYCRNGFISAEKLLPNTPAVKSEYAFLNDPAFRPIARSPDAFGAVQLEKGIQGFFVPWVLGANYSDAKVIWEQSGYRYTVSLKKGDRQALIEMANSAINSSP